MKTLYIARHCKSSWDHPDLSDHERPLNARGERDAPLMSAVLAERIPRLDLILTSSAVRAETSARFFAKHLDSVQVKVEQRLYDAGPQTYLDCLAGISDGVSSLLLVGHNPTVTSLAAILTGAQVESMPTCAVIGMRLDINDWTEIYSSRNATVLFLEYPKKHK